MATTTSARRRGDRQGAMAARGSAVAGRAAEAWTAFSLPQKVITVLLAAGLIAGAVLVSRSVAQPQYAPLFTNLSGEDAGAIVDQLQTAGVPYELTDGGGTVLVPRQQVYDQRIAMSTQGLPQSSQSGYSLLDEQGVTTSQFQQQVAYQRALEGELSRTIGAIDGVEAAVVHLAIPARDVFLEESRTPTASVLVQTTPGAEIDGDRVRSIVHLVSSSVEGLPAESVTVVDGEGRLLSAPGTDLGGGSTAMDAVVEYETALTFDIQRLLDVVVGAGNAVASVSAELDFDESEATTERFLAEAGLPPLQEETTTEDYTGTGTVPGGILGPDNNGVPLGGDGDSTYNRETRTATNAVGKVTERTVSSPGAVSRLSVSVVVDTQNAGAVDLASLAESVAAAAGIDPARGDTLSVTRLPFDTTAAEAAQQALEEASGAQAAAQRWSVLRTVALVVVIVVVVVATLLAARRRRPSVDVLDISPLEEPAGDRQLAALDAALGAAALDARQRTPESLEVGRRGQEVADLVERQPDEVADLLRTWLADRRS
jgi:flagellar M-ring protein FliF